MSKRPTTARSCGEQDCNLSSNHPDQPLCLNHYRMLQAGDIAECPNCRGVYKPSAYMVCQQCYCQQRRQPPANEQMRARRNNRFDDSKGWNLRTEPATSPRAPADTVQAVNLVRKNIAEHRHACENHETNTIQYLVMPMLNGLGYDETDPAQVVKEFKPAGRRRNTPSMAVDIALMNKGVPATFIEAKRLDREYDHEYMAQLSKYAAHLRDGGTAALTNGRFWIVCAVASGKLEHRDTIDISESEAATVAVKLNNVLGKSTIGKNANGLSSRAAASRQSASNPNAIRNELKRYREQEAKRRHVPPYYILNNDIIDRIVEAKPADFNQLRKINGVGPATIDQHGAAVIAITQSESPQSLRSRNKQRRIKKRRD